MKKILDPFIEIQKYPCRDATPYRCYFRVRYPYLLKSYKPGEYKPKKDIHFTPEEWERADKSKYFDVVVMKGFDDEPDVIWAKYYE